MNPKSLSELEGRPQKHWNVDGLPELMMGVLWLIWGGLWLLGDRFAGGQERGVYWTAAPVAVVLLALSAKRVLRAVKARVTYPRVGYAEARTGGWRATVAALAVALLVAVFGLSCAGSPQAVRAIPAIVSFGIAAVFVLVSRRLGAGYLRWVAVIPAAMGVYAWRAGLGAASFRWLFLLLGAVCTAGGAVRLRRFLRDNPAPPGTAG